MLPQSELGTLYFHALACIVPSITYETFGMIIIEAFARSTPVIVRDLGGLPRGHPLHRFLTTRGPPGTHG